MPEGSQITDVEALPAYLLGGYATVTIVSKSSGRRFTYRVEMRRIKRKPSETDAAYGERVKEAQAGVRFVTVLTGPDNENSYSYIGHVNEHHEFTLDRRSQFAPTAPSVAAWKWFWSSVMAKSDKVAEQCEVWHDGRCSRCRRKLTVPESVASGLGPICAGK